MDTVFQAGEEVILRTAELLDAADIGKLRPRWEGPFQVTALAGPNTYTLALPPRFRCSHDRFATRADKREGANPSFVHFAQVTTVLGSEG